MAHIDLVAKKKNLQKRTSSGNKRFFCTFSNYVQNKSKEESRKSNKVRNVLSPLAMQQDLLAQNRKISTDSMIVSTTSDNQEILKNSKQDANSKLKKQKKNDGNSKNSEWIVADNDECVDLKDELYKTDKFLDKSIQKLREPTRIFEATPDMANLMGERDDLKKREVKEMTNEDGAPKFDFEEEDDVELVALALAYGNARCSLRESSTYRLIMKQSQRLHEFVDPQILFVRLKSLCSKSNLTYFRKLCGMEIVKSKNNPQEVDRLKESCNYIRASILDMDDVYRYNLTKYARCYVKPKRVKPYTRPWLKELNLDSD